MRLLLIAGTIVALSLIACSGTTEPATGTGPLDSPFETPEYTDSPPSDAPLTTKSPGDTLHETPAGTGPLDSPIETPEHRDSPPTDAPTTRESHGNTLVETPSYTGVIISEEGASAFRYMFSEESIQFWAPSVDDVFSAEACIRRFLESAQDNENLDDYQKESAAAILGSLEEYRRQYVGIVLDGEERVWCNVFLDDPYQDWERFPVDVDGGGSHFWQIEYNPLTNECTDFNVHGQS